MSFLPYSRQVDLATISAVEYSRLFGADTGE
jgi:hypothetical protein